MAREVVGAIIDCPRCKNGCRYCHGHRIIIGMYKTPVIVPDPPKRKPAKRSGRKARAKK
jgi:hypothetical protein